jgi:hypothetical protein
MSVKSHIDPISHDPIPAEHLVEINMSSNHIEYFDIENLHTWFITRGEPINPLTNIGFTKKQVQDIRSAYIKYKKAMPYFLHPNPNEEKEKEEEQKKEEHRKFVHHFIDLCGIPDKFEELRDLLYTHVGDIQNDTFNLNSYKVVQHELLHTITPITNAIINDNLFAIQELLIFNPELNYTDTKHKYTAIDLAVLNNGKNSYSILEHLLCYGASMNPHTYELSNDPAKLELLYTFMYQQ